MWICKHVSIVTGQVILSNKSRHSNNESCTQTKILDMYVTYTHKYIYSIYKLYTWLLTYVKFMCLAQKIQYLTGKSANNYPLNFHCWISVSFWRLVLKGKALRTCPQSKTHVPEQSKQRLSKPTLQTFHTSRLVATIRVGRHVNNLVLQYLEKCLRKSSYILY